jgi:hypothetical protein
LRKWIAHRKFGQSVDEAQAKGWTVLQPRAIYPVPGGVEIQVIAEGSLQLSVR